MSEKVDIEKIKSQLIDKSRLWRRKINDLKLQVDRQGGAGVSWWLKTHHQIDELQAALEQLQIDSQREDFCLKQVEPVLLDFQLPEEDLAQANWYTQAHQKIEAFHQSITDNQQFDKKLLEAALKELRFISEADEFHQRYNLQSLQHEVRTMYQQLTAELQTYKKGEKEKITQQKEKDEIEKVRLEKEKAEAEAKQAMAKNIAIKEKRLAIIEEKKRLVIAKEAADAERLQKAEAAEIEAKQAEIKRQEKLQDSYLELQIEERLNSMPLEELLEFVKKQIEHKTILTFVQQDQLDKLRQVIEQKKS